MHFILKLQKSLYPAFKCKRIRHAYYVAFNPFIVFVLQYNTIQIHIAPKVASKRRCVALHCVLLSYIAFLANKLHHVANTSIRPSV